MKKISRRQLQNKEKIEKKKYEIDKAISLVQQSATCKFNETIELHANLNIDSKYADQQLRTTITLPHGRGKKIKIAVLVTEDKISEAKEYNADIVGSSDLIDNITKGKIDFDLLIAMPEMMPKLAKLGRILGPKGLMPAPKSGTVTENIKETVSEFKKGKFEYKADKTGIVHVSFGKASFQISELKDNLIELYKSIEQNKPTGVKGKYLNSFFICSAMGPSIELDLLTFDKLK
jgi:large subunit ribosomal protein L1